jgi:putative restriction endonuclease
MRGYVANTHADWFDFLAQKGRWDEVNFWNPSDYYAFRGERGSPFFFRLKSPRNAIGGFGLVQRFDKLPEWLAWECFEEGNGAPTFELMQSRLHAIREKSDIKGKSELRQIGCIILAQAIFFPEALWIRQPSDWAPQNLRYTGYDLTEGEGERIWRECLERATPTGLFPGFARESESTDSPLAPNLARRGTPVLVAPRLGAFRLAVTDAYARACAVTQEHSLPVLEAAHIKPFAHGGEHEVSNGLLLRSDLHRLFDRGYLTVTPEHRIEVSPLLREHFSNGRSYYPLHGQSVIVPKRGQHVPAADALRWHNERVFRA